MTVKYVKDFEFPTSFGFKPAAKVQGYKAGGLVKKAEGGKVCGPKMKSGGSVTKTHCGCDGMKKGGKVKSKGKSKSRKSKKGPTGLTAQEQQLLMQVVQQAAATGRPPGLPGAGGVPVASDEPMIPMQ